MKFTEAAKSIPAEAIENPHLASICNFAPIIRSGCAILKIIFFASGAAKIAIAALLAWLDTQCPATE